MKLVRITQDLLRRAGWPIVEEYLLKRCNKRGDISDTRSIGLYVSAANVGRWWATVNPWLKEFPHCTISEMQIFFAPYISADLFLERFPWAGDAKAETVVRVLKYHELAHMRLGHVDVFGVKDREEMEKAADELAVEWYRNGLPALLPPLNGNGPAPERLSGFVYRWNGNRRFPVSEAISPRNLREILDTIVLGELAKEQLKTISR